MKLPNLWSGGRGDPGLIPRNQGLLPQAFWSLQNDFEEMLRVFDRLPSLRGATGLPKVSVAERKDAFDIAVELPGVDEKDIRLDVEDNLLVVSGEKKEEARREERDWHVEERSYGSFYRAIPLPFRPDDKSVEAFLEKGVLNITVKKPPEAQQQGRRGVEIKSRDSLGRDQAASAEGPPRQQQQTGQKPQQQDKPSKAAD